MEPTTAPVKSVMTTCWAATIQEPDQDPRCHLFTTDVTTVGRGKRADLTLKDSGASRIHAQFRVSDGRLTVKACETANGVRVGATTIKAEQELNEGDIVRVGRCSLTVVQTIGELPPDVFEGYRLLTRISVGPMDTVFRARHEVTDSIVAIKVVLLPNTTERTEQARLLNAIRSSGRLDDPHVLPVSDSGITDGLLYIVMPWAANGSLISLMEDGTPLPPPIMLALALDAARGLATAAEAGVTHHHFQPGDILIDKTGIGRIGDLGLAANLPGRDENKAYAAPETLNDEIIDPIANQFSLGAMLYRGLSGVAAFAPGRQTSNDHRTPIAKRCPSLPQPALEVVERLLATDPEDRYPNWTEAIDALERALAACTKSATGSDDRTATRGTRQVTRKPPTRQTHPRNRMPPYIRNMLWAIGLLLVGLLLLAILGP